MMTPCENCGTSYLHKSGVLRWCKACRALPDYRRHYLNRYRQTWYAENRDKTRQYQAGYRKRQKVNYLKTLLEANRRQI